MLSKGVIFIHDNARPYASNVTKHSYSSLAGTFSTINSQDLVPRDSVCIWCLSLVVLGAWFPQFLTEGAACNEEGSWNITGPLSKNSVTIVDFCAINCFIVSAFVIFLITKRNSLSESASYKKWSLTHTWDSAYSVAVLIPCHSSPYYSSPTFYSLSHS